MKYTRGFANRIYIGFKKGIFTPTLPVEIIKIQSSLIIRIIRFLGGASFLVILGNNYINYNLYVLYVSMFFAILFTIYHIVISYYRFKHIIKIIKSDQLEIKNSPLDRLATLSAKTLLCLKGLCETAQPVGLTLGLMLGTDEILKSANREPIFAPFLGGILNSALPSNTTKDSNQLISKSLDQLEGNNVEIQATNSLLDRFKSLNLKGDITQNELKEFQELLKENQLKLLNENQLLKSKIIEELEKFKK